MWSWHLTQAHDSRHYMVYDCHIDNRQQIIIKNILIDAKAFLSSFKDKIYLQFVRIVFKLFASFSESFNNQNFLKFKTTLLSLKQFIWYCWWLSFNNNVATRVVYLCKIKLYLKWKVNHKLLSNDLLYIWKKLSAWSIIWSDHI